MPVSSSGGDRPKWNRSGSELFYLAADRITLMSVRVEWKGTEPQLDAARPLFRFIGPMPAPNTVVSPYEVAADGKRFLAIEPVDQPEPPLTVVTNWRARLPETD